MTNDELTNLLDETIKRLRREVDDETLASVMRNSPDPGTPPTAREVFDRWLEECNVATPKSLTDREAVLAWLWVRGHDDIAALRADVAEVITDVNASATLLAAENTALANAVATVPGQPPPVPVPPIVIPPA